MTAKLNSQGREAGRRTPHEALEEGQIEDTLLCIQASNDEFSLLQVDSVSEVDSRVPGELDTDLDYEGVDMNLVVEIKDSGPVGAVS